MDYINNFDFTIVFRLLFAVVLGGIIGFERGGNRHEAGLRTHIVLCLGAATVMVVSQALVENYGIPDEIMRMGAQVISGVGFLGVGSIIVDGNKIRGITTAAGLWTTACIGLAVGSGLYVIAIVVVCLMMFALLGLKSLTRNLKNRVTKFSIKLKLDEIKVTKQVFELLERVNVSISSIKIEENKDKVDLILEITLPKSVSVDNLVCNLSEIGGVKEFSEI